MKKHFFIACCAGILLVSFTHKGDQEIYGTWKGGFGDEAAITETIVELKQQNKAEVYEDVLHQTLKINGTFEVKGDTVLILTYFEPCSQHKTVLYGNLNPSKNFVEGIWQSASQIKGSFYLHKSAR